MSDKHDLTVKELTFITNRIKKGLTLDECYKKYNPKTTQGKDNRNRSGWAVMAQIKKKIGTWPGVYEVAGLGPDRIAHVFEDAITAESYQDVYEQDKKTKEYVRKTVVAADHRTRVYAAKELKEIHGMSEETVNLKITAKDITDNKPFLEKVAERMAKFDREHNTRRT